MKKIFTLAFSLAAMFLLADVYFGDKAAVTSLHPTTNFLISVLGSSSNAPVRLINTSNLLTGYATSNDLVSATNSLATTNYVNSTTNSLATTNYVNTVAGGSGIAYTNTVWVATNGNNATGARGDASKPFKTPSAARTNAQAGDTIFVMPGTYYDSDLAKNMVDWHFIHATIIQTTGKAGDPSIWDDKFGSAAGAITSNITGDGTFSCQYAPAGATFYTENANTRITVTARQMDMASASAFPVVIVKRGTVIFNGIEITSTNAGSEVISANELSSLNLTINNCRIVNTNSTFANGCVLSAWSDHVTLRDCVLIANTNATAPIAIRSDGTTHTVNIYGTMIANLTSDPKIAFSGSGAWPVSQGAAGTALTNNGTGVFGWGALPTAGFAAVEVQTNGVRVGLVTNLNYIGATGQLSSLTAIIGGFSGGGGSGSLTGTTNFLNLSVQAAKLPTTNYPGIDAGWQDWETIYYETNAEGIRTNLTASWQFTVPPDYGTNSLKVRIQSLLLSTNGPNSSNTIFWVDFIRATPGDSTDLHTASYGTAFLGTNTWSASFNGTNKLQSLLISTSTNCLLSAGDMAIMRVTRDAFDDTHGGATAVVGLQLEYTRP